MSFIPDNILNCCEIIHIPRPTTTNYVKCFKNKLPNNVKLENITNIKNLHLYDENLMLCYKIISNKVIDHIIDFNNIQFMKFRDIIYDFLIYNDRSTLPNNIKIIKNLPNNKEDFKKLLENRETYEYEKSNIKFILTEIIFEGKPYKLDLSTKNVNFYIKDNIFNYSFFLYYLRYYHEEYNTLLLNIFNSMGNSGVPIEITLKLIDQNVNSFYMDLNNDTDYLVIQKDDYIIDTLNKKK